MPIESGLENPEEKKIILEIGTGDSPIVGHSKGVGKDIRDDEQKFYIALEETEEIKGAAKKSRNREWQGDHNLRTLFIQGDAIRAPFKNNSVNEVILRSVLGDPDNRFSSHSIVAEIHRILKPKGVLTIVELYTPEVAKSFFKKSDIDIYFKKINFTENMEAINENFGGLASGFERKKPFIYKLEKK